MFTNALHRYGNLAHSFKCPRELVRADTAHCIPAQRAAYPRPKRAHMPPAHYLPRAPAGLHHWRSVTDLPNIQAVALPTTKTSRPSFSPNSASTVLWSRDVPPVRLSSATFLTNPERVWSAPHPLGYAPNRTAYPAYPILSSTDSIAWRPACLRDHHGRSPCRSLRGSCRPIPASVTLRTVSRALAGVRSPRAGDPSASPSLGTELQPSYSPDASG